GFSYPQTQLASGQIVFQYSPTSPLTDDYVLATGTDNLFGSGSYGIKVDMAGNVTRFDPTAINAPMLQSIVNSNSGPVFDVSTDSDLQELISAVDSLTTPSNACTSTIDVGPATYGDILASPPSGGTLDLVDSGGTAAI